MSDDIWTEIKKIWREIDILKSFDVPSASGLSGGFLLLDASNDPITNDLEINDIKVGHGAGDESSNTLLGNGLQNVTSGTNNTAVGMEALVNLTDGEFNTAVGRYALNSLVSGIKNTAVGRYALVSCLGSRNTGNGVDSSVSLTTGNENTSLGHQSLSQNTTGSKNVSIGNQAGAQHAAGNLTSPENSIYIGAESKGFDNNDSNSIVIGYQAVGAGPNKVVLGNTSIDETILRGVLTTAAQAIHKVFIGPASGSDAAPTFRVLASDDIPVDIPHINQTIALTAQVAAIGTTAITGTNTAGLYRVHYYLEDTTLDLTAGTIMANFAYTDDAGATTMSSVALPLTALGRTQGTLFIRVLGTGSISYSTTLVGLIGTSQYALFISCEKLL